MGMGPIIISGVFQGFGLGFVFVPLSIVTFSTLPRHILTQGTAIFSLMRNIGGSVGISIVVALLAENTQIVHSRLVEHLRPDNPLAQRRLAPPFSLTDPSGIAALNAEVDPPGGDGRLCRRFQADDDHRPPRRAAAALVAQAAPRAPPPPPAE